MKTCRNSDSNANNTLLLRPQEKEKISAQEQKLCVNSEKKDDSIKVLKAFGISIIGLDPRLIVKAKLEIKIPLNAGKNHVPLMNKDVKIDIHKKTTADVVVELGRNEQGQLSLVSFSFNSNPGINVKNPASISAKESGKNSFKNEVKDKIADLKIKTIMIDKNGNISVNGKIKAFNVLKKRIPRHAGALKLPVLDEKTLLKLGALGSVLSSGSSIDGGFDIKSLLESLGAITKESSYSLNVNAEPMHAVFAKDNNFFRGPVSPIDINLKGVIDLTKKGEMMFVIDGQKSKFSGSLGIYSPHVEARLSNLIGPKPLTLDFHSRVKGVGRELRLDTFSKQEVKTVMPRTRKFEKAVPMPHDENEYNLSFGVKSVEVSTSIDAVVEIGETAKESKKKGISFQVKKGEANIDLVAHDPYARTHERGIKMDGALSASIEAKNLKYSSEQGFNKAKIDTRFGLYPSNKITSQFPEMRSGQFAYKTRVNGANRATIKPPSYGLSRFLRPVKNFESNDERVNTIETKTNINAIGTKQYFRQVQKISGMTVNKADQVELLIDGIKSMPKRLKLIDEAKHSICFQTLVFKGDNSGWTYAKALVNAVKRGVKVYGVIDSLGNIESFKDLMSHNEIYDYLRRNGVELYLYNSFVEQGLRLVFDVARRNKDLFPPCDSLMGVAELLRFFEAIAEIAEQKQGPLSLKDKMELAQGIHIIFGGKEGVSPHLAVSEIKKAIAENMTSLDEMLLAIKRIGDATYRWHEKYLIVDGHEAIVGGMNIADEYLHGGSGEMVTIKGKSQPAWRDSDVYISGPVVRDIAKNFRQNWLHVANKELPIAKSNKNNRSLPFTVGMIHHRPWEDGDHNVTNFLLYNLRTLKASEKAWFETPYFLPRGALRALQREMVRAAMRGVDLRILTNSEKTSDFGPLVEAAVFDTRELLKAGARVFHRNNDRMVHAKVYVLGDKLTLIGSWNMDNRSAAHDSEDICAIYDSDITNQMSEQLLIDMFEQSDEVKLSDLKERPIAKEIRSAAMLMMGELV